MVITPWTCVLALAPWRVNLVVVGGQFVAVPFMAGTVSVVRQVTVSALTP